jgi:ribosomal protein S18 acetylase RimI-like enzyme
MNVKKIYQDNTGKLPVIAREVDDTLYLQQIDVAPEHGRRGIGSTLVNTVCERS